MLLSEAIRLGAMMRPKGIGTFFTGAGGSCALGAALEASGNVVREFQAGVDILVDRFPILNTENISTTVRRLPYNCLMDAVMDLNDRTDLTREEIADYVQTFEAAQDSVTSTNPPQAVAGLAEPATEHETSTSLMGVA